MSAFAAIGVYSRQDDWLFAGAFLIISYLICYPLYLLLVRVKHTRRIKNQLVTSIYKLPINLTPSELSYVFSTRVTMRQLYATILDLANRSVLLVEKKDNVIYVSVGPRIDPKLQPYEQMLLNRIQEYNEKISLKKVAMGIEAHKKDNKVVVQGSRQYVFWWLLRENLRSRKLIERHMTGRYGKMLFTFGVFWTLVLAVGPLLVFRTIQSLDSGEINVVLLADAFQSGVILWFMVLPVSVTISFFLLRLRGHMLGREWLMTPKFKHYLQQLEVYREFVRLTHQNKLHFESKELKKEAMAATRPFAVVFGYIKD